MRKRASSLRTRLVKWLCALLLVPFALTLIYRLVPPPSTLMLADLVTLQRMQREWVPLERISPSLVSAVVASEDDAFCSHFGFDFNQIGKSISVAGDGGELRGASTISQQTAKNLFLWNGRSWLRKALEVPLTLWLELSWPKRRILEVYLNIAEWGDGIYGAEAAARTHFGTSANRLGSWQSALLAAALPDPRHRNSGHPGPGQTEIAAQIERRLSSSRPDLHCLRR